MARRRVAQAVVAVVASAAMLCVAVVGAVPRAIPVAADEITVSDRIINGDPVPIEDAPWQVGIGSVIESAGPQTEDSFSGPVCGGSLISADWVVSAAHCFDDPIPNAHVVVGVADLFNDIFAPNVIAIDSVTQHPAWNPGTDENDIALVRLSTPVDTGAVAAAPIALPWWQDPGTWPAAGSSATISGWGDTTPGAGSTFPTELQLATVDVLAAPTDPVCGRYGSIYKGSSMLCAADLQAGVDSCQGDSGGPLVTVGNGEPRLAGITSFGIGCANGVDPGVYARVTNYLDWIDALTGLGPEGWTASVIGLEPARLYESRPSLPTIDGLQQTAQRVAAGTVVEIEVAGRGGVAADAVAALVNVVAVRPNAEGFLTLFPCASSPQPPEGRPGSSTLNFAAGEVVANSALVHIGVGGRICVYAHRTTDLVLDVTGFVPLGASAIGLRPSRLLETRFGAPTVDDVPATFNGVPISRGRIPAGLTIEVQVAGRAGVPVDASAAWVNVAAVLPDAQGFVTLFPCGSPRPGASTLNYAAGAVVASGSLIELGANGTVCIFTNQTTDLLLDVSGFLPSGSPVVGLLPARLFETRRFETTFDGRFAGVGRLAAGSVTEIPVTGRDIVPSEARAVTVNVAAIEGAADGFITLYPCDRPRPEASTLNFAAGEVVSNGAFVPLDPGGSICLYAHQATDAILDVTGWAPA